MNFKLGHYLGRWVPSFTTSLIIAAAIAMVGFFFLHGPYFPQLGIVGNAMNNGIYFTDECLEKAPSLAPSAGFDLAPTTPLPRDFGLAPTTNPFRDVVPEHFLCGVVLSYRWLLAALVVFVAVCGYFQTKRPKSN